jgi:hypothetical protein
MTKVSISDDKLIIDVQGLHKIWAMRSRLEIPVDHITAVRRAADERPSGLRWPGTFVPGLITAGTYYGGDGKPVFWDVQNHENAIAIELHDESFSTVIVEVADPEATVREILNAFGSWTMANA